MEEENIKYLTDNCELCTTKPCQIGCPLNNDITKFIKYTKEKEYEKAYLTLLNTSSLPSICARVCAKSLQCERSCVKGVSFKPVQIGELERIVGDMGLEYSWNIKSKEKTNYSVAVIGSGPASLCCADFLSRYGISVTIYEKHSHLGGLLSHGIPEFVLDREIVEKTIDTILKKEIVVNYNQELGKDILLENLEEEYDAIFIGIGANTPKPIQLKGSQKNGVFYANEFLENQILLNFKGKEVVVYGGGNTAIDIARLSKKNGANKVYILYHKEEKYLSAYESEVNLAKEEGIEFLFQTCLTEIKGESKVEKITFQRTLLKDDKLTLVENSELELECDYVFLALGATTSENLSSLNLEMDENNHLKVSLLGETSNPKVYAGGDVTGSKSTVAHASRSGRNAAYAILKKLGIEKGENENE